MNVVIVGGVAGGMSTASRLKRLLKDQVNIIVFEQGDEVSYGACGIPFYISDHIKDKESLFARTVEQFIEEGIDLRIHHRVEGVDIEAKTIVVKQLKTGEVLTQSYDYLVIASGARVNRFAPMDQPYNNLYEVRQVQDGTNIKNELKKDSVKNVVVVGAGFIGMEVAEACKEWNKNVTIVEFAPRVMSLMDEEITSALEIEANKQGVSLMLESKVVGFEHEDQVINKVHVESFGSVQLIDADIVINCAGIKPNTEFVTGVDKAFNGALIVDQNMETNVKGIYAAGDCSIMKSSVTNQLTYAPLGTNANKQGRIIADVIAGVKPKPFKLISSSGLKFFTLSAGKVGVSELEAIRLELNYKAHIITGNAYAGYYSNKEKILVKVLYNPDTRVIIGAQLVGQGSVVERANYYALAIYNHMTVDQFGMMDFAYSPPFNGVWDVAQIGSNTIK